MKTYFLHKNENSSNLILFFSGFCSHFSHFLHLKSKENVLIIYDYSDFNFECDLKKYEKITLIAWSMGVCVASKILKNINFYKKIAINGTNLPINKEFGIKESIFKLSMKNFKLEDFKKNMFEEKLNLSENFFFNDELYLKNELNFLYEFCTQDLNENFTWDKAFLSEDDKIFPFKASLNFFKEKACILNSPHFVFFDFNTWEELCKLS
ncbi:DUF452 family protein [Campylobacter lari]|uniref:pimeloyl-ACP methyl esterase BioG family protein n=1 Tax=Campylobacter lari TaxID=201 RepID=UPI0021F6B4BF|nr:pimeloyl-ACP methyl esterase BioG family protein [Campylobacter lari]MCW0228557.1 DUF452 family protein [Campylobacter lari]